MVTTKDVEVIVAEAIRQTHANAQAATVEAFTGKQTAIQQAEAANAAADSAGRQTAIQQRQRQLENSGCSKGEAAVAANMKLPDPNPLPEVKAPPLVELDPGALRYAKSLDLAKLPR